MEAGVQLVKLAQKGLCGLMRKGEDWLSEKLPVATSPGEQVDSTKSNHTRFWALPYKILALHLLA